MNIHNAYSFTSFVKTVSFVNACNSSLTYFYELDVVSSDVSTQEGITYDYKPVLHTVVFGVTSDNPQETMVSFEIQVKDDNIVENVESFNLILENVSGALLGYPRVAEVYIQDNDGKLTYHFYFCSFLCFVFVFVLIVEINT